MTQPLHTAGNIQSQRQLLEPFHAAVSSIIVGQEKLVEGLLIGLLTDGHVLVEGVPGLAKTLAIRTVAAALDLRFRRVQFTPDLLPADIIGTQIFHPATGEFTVKPGPIFANVILADEINRAPAKVQSALLEAMQERSVTLGESTRPLPEPFFVLATQNPIEQEGTYPLPEAQLDRFMMKLTVGFPSKAEEAAIVNRHSHRESVPLPKPVLSAADFASLKNVVDGIVMDDRVADYAVEIVRATRSAPAAIAMLIEHGASPRGSMALVKAAKAHAFLAGRHYATPDDVKALAPACLRHRIVPSFEADAENVTADAIVEKILATVAVP
jgi:MoxR-like ATPase